MKPIKSMEVVTVDTTGALASMHSDNGILNKVGKLHVERATEILHDEGTGTWYIDPRIGDSLPETLPEALQGFTGYDKARAFEVSWVKICNLLGYDFVEDRKICAALRTLYEDHLRGVEDTEPMLLPTPMLAKGRETGVHLLVGLMYKKLDSLSS